MIRVPQSPTGPLVLERWVVTQPAAFAATARIPHRLVYYPDTNTLRVEWVAPIGVWLPCDMPTCLPSFK